MLGESFNPDQVDGRLSAGEFAWLRFFHERVGQNPPDILITFRGDTRQVHVKQVDEVSATGLVRILAYTDSYMAGSPDVRCMVFPVLEISRVDVFFSDKK